MDSELLAASKAWPITEASTIVERFKGAPPAKGYVLFETGYGPSGLPHIGTFGEVFRTTMVRQAFARLSDIPTRLFAFSDDMDGLRKVPDNIPNAEMVAQHLGRPLTAIPDPFGTAESFGHNMNARLRAFLDRFGFSYEFRSGSACYTSGEFDATLLKVLRHHDAICAIVRPELGPARRASYSPILPISPKTGRVLQVPIEETRPDDGTVVFRDEDGALCEVPVTGGQCKLQWRADWALRWTALAVDYEMSGKDLIDSVRLSSRICREIGGTPPLGFIYEHFLDEHGAKISKSKGNGLTIDEWLRYGTRESLMLFMFQQPRKAKRLHFDVIPRQVDDYQSLIDAYPDQDDAKRLSNPVWHIHDGAPPAIDQPVSFAMLLNLAAVVNAESPDVLWGFIQNYRPDCTPQTHPRLAELVAGAVNYYQDRVRPTKAYRSPTSEERAALQELADWLAGVDPSADAQALQNEVYEIGKRHGFDNLRDWFRAIYETLLGQSAGPRFGSFIALYGVANTRALITEMLEKGRLGDAA